MPTDSTRLTRRRLLGSIVTVGAAGTAAGAGTRAYFTDGATGPSSLVDSGTLALQVDGSKELGLGATLTPGSSVTGSVTLVSTGSIRGSLDVDVEYTEDDSSDNGTDVSADRVAELLRIDQLDYSGQPALQTTPANLKELATRESTTSEGDDILNLADPGTGTDFTIALRYPKQSKSKDAHGDGISVTFTFTLNQTDVQ